MGHCRRCDDLDNEARSRDDLTIYRAMLRQLHKTEEARKDGSHVIFLIQVYIHYTVASEMSLALVVSMGLRALPLHIPYRVT